MYRDDITPLLAASPPSRDASSPPLGDAPPPATLRLVMVDHNRLAEAQAALGGCVVEIIDHHFEEGLYTSSAAGAARRVRSVGSCATLVTAEILARAPELMLSKPEPMMTKQRPEDFFSARSVNDPSAHSLSASSAALAASAVLAAAAAATAAVAAATLALGGWALGALPPGGADAVSPGLARLLLAPVRGRQRRKGWGAILFGAHVKGREGEGVLLSGNGNSSGKLCLLMSRWGSGERERRASTLLTLSSRASPPPPSPGVAGHGLPGRQPRPLHTR